MYDCSSTAAEQLSDFDMQFMNAMQEDVIFNELIPISENSSELPKFPAQCLPECIRNYVNAVSRETQTAVDMAAVQSLAMLSICSQSKWRIMGKYGHYEPLNIYTLILSDPATRKSQVQNLLAKPIREFEKQKNAELAPKVAEYNAMLAYKKAELSSLYRKTGSKSAEGTEARAIQLSAEITELEQNAVTPIKLYSDDCTPEQLVTLTYENKERMSIISAEGSIFGNLSGRYSNGISNIEFVLHAHAGEPVRVERRGRSECMEAPALTMALMVQPCILEGLFSDKLLLEKGFTARFLYSSPPSTLGKRSYKAETAEFQSYMQNCYNSYETLLHELLSYQPDEDDNLIRLSQEAFTQVQELFSRTEQELLNGCFEAMRDWGGKYVGMVLRIAGLLHLATDKNYNYSSRTVSSETMRNAVLIGEYFKAHAVSAYGVMGADENIKSAEFIISKLKANRTTTLTGRDLYRLCRSRYFKESSDMEKSINMLIENGYLAMQEQTAEYGRKKTPLYYVNTKIFAF